MYENEKIFLTKMYFISVFNHTKKTNSNLYKI